jgi:hypothetical protein
VLFILGYLSDVTQQVTLSGCSKWLLTPSFKEIVEKIRQHGQRPAQGQTTQRRPSTPEPKKKKKQQKPEKPKSAVRRNAYSRQSPICMFCNAFFLDPRTLTELCAKVIAQNVTLKQTLPLPVGGLDIDSFAVMTHATQLNTCSRHITYQMWEPSTNGDLHTLLLD